MFVNVTESSPDPPLTDRTPAASALTFNAVVNESPVAVEPWIVPLAPG